MPPFLGLWEFGLEVPFAVRTFSYILLSVQCLSDLEPGLVPVHCGKAVQSLAQKYI